MKIQKYSTHAPNLQVLDYMLKESRPGISIFGGDMNVRDFEISRIKNIQNFEVSKCGNAEIWTRISVVSG